MSGVIRTVPCGCESGQPCTPATRCAITTAVHIQREDDEAEMERLREDHEAELAALRAQFDAAEKARCHAVMLNGDYTEELAALRVEHERLKGDYSEEAVHLRTRAVRAEAELSALRAEAPTAWVYEQACKALHERAERAEAEAAGLRADAERWRAVSAMMTHEHRGDAVGWALSVLLPGDDPDAAIDAAREREGE